MWRRSLIAALLAAALALVLAAVYGLFAAGMHAGETYAPYSSLRTDPLGAKILHDSLAELPGRTVGRWMKSDEKLRLGAGAVLFHLGADARWPAAGEGLRALTDFVAGGGTLVMAFAPIAYVPSTNIQRRAMAAGAPDEDEEVEDEDAAAGTNRTERGWLEERWGCGIAFAAVREDWRDEMTQIGGTSLVGRALSTDGARRALTCRTTLYFDPRDPAWRVLYERDRHPVILERAFGRGRLALCAEAYPLSNEAMVRERRTELVAGWVGGATNIWFAEGHLGVQEQAGIMTLVNRYGLQGGVLALLLLAGLFIWRQATPLVPPEDEARGADFQFVGGRQSAEGLVNLLRRGVPAGRLADRCWEEWSRTAVAPERKRERIRRALEAARGRPQQAVEAYRQAARILAEKEW